MDKASVTQAESTPESTTLPCIQGSYPFQPETNFQDFSRIHINFSRLLNSKKFLITYPIHFIFYYFSLQIFPEQAAFFQEFPVLENATIKFKDFPGFSGPVRNLCLTG